MTEFSFETIGGIQWAKLYDGASGAAPIVVIAPAIGIEARYYQGLCEALAAQGIGAVGIDMPGHGASPIRAGRQHDWGYRGLVDHFEAAVEVLAKLRPDSPIFLVGHSLGGHVALMLTGQTPSRVRGVVLVACGVPYWRAWRYPGALVLRVGSELYRALALVLGYFPGRRLGFGGRESKTLILQWAKSAQTGRYDFDGFSGEELLSRPGPPVLSIGLRSDFFAPEASIRFLLAKLVARAWRYTTWEAPPHGGDHNRWPTEPKYVIDRVIDFIAETD
ncbi:MAG: alpha/beta fold hydrolase [Acidimicrobiia bacterium]